MRILKTSTILLFSVIVPLTSSADTSINAANSHAYGANIGWINARGDVTNGAVIGQFYCTGSVWSANTGWISLGNGPTNGFSYSNASASDWGVNHNGAGKLSGYAYGANIGWINFETNGNPRVNLITGNLSGYAYGANVGWISLSNSQAFVQTDYLDSGPDTDGDGIPDAWEYAQVGNLTNLNMTGDFDEDGVKDIDEYDGDTNPDDDESFLRVTEIKRDDPQDQVTWTVEPTRLYALETADSTTNDADWVDSGLGIVAPGGGPTLSGDVTDTTSTTRFYRAKSVVPLTP